MIISNFFKVLPGHSTRGKVEESPGTGIKYIQLKNTSENQVVWKDMIEIDLGKTRFPKYLENGDVIFAARNAKFYSVYLEDVENYGKVLAARQFFILRSISENILPEFLAWQLNQFECQNYFDEHKEGSVTVNIKRVTIEQTPIHVPSISRQRDIIDLKKYIHEQELSFDRICKSNTKIMNSIAASLKAEES